MLSYFLTYLTNLDFFGDIPMGHALLNQMEVQAWFQILES
jgi:hypothetical protein